MSYANLQSSHSRSTDIECKQQQSVAVRKFIKTDHQIENIEQSASINANQIVEPIVQCIIGVAISNAKINYLLAHVAIQQTFSVLIDDPNMGIIDSSSFLPLHRQNAIKREEQPKNYAFIDGSIGMVKMKNEDCTTKSKVHKKPSLHSDETLKTKSNLKKPIKRTSKCAGKNQSQHNQQQNMSKQNGKNMDDKTTMTLVSLIEQQEDDKITNYLRYIKVEREINSKIAANSETNKQSQISPKLQTALQQQQINLKINKIKNSKSLNAMSYQSCITVSEGQKINNVYGNDYVQKSQNVSRRSSKVRQKQNKFNKSVQFQKINKQKQQIQLKENSKRGSVNKNVQSCATFSLPKLVTTNKFEVKQQCLCSPNLDQKLKIGEYSNKLQIFMSNNIKKSNTIFTVKTNFDEKSKLNSRSQSDYNMKCIQMSAKSTITCNFRKESQNKVPRLSEIKKNIGKQIKKKTKANKKDEIYNQLINKTETLKGNQSEFSLPIIRQSQKNRKFL